MEGSFGRRQYERLGRQKKEIYIISRWFLAHFFYNRWWDVSYRQNLEAYTGQKCDCKVIL